MKGFSTFFIVMTLSLFVMAEDYSRSGWGGWDDADKDCMSTRNEVLKRDSLVDTTGKCKVETGIWVTHFTSRIYYTPRKLDIDHVIPLKWAHDHGGEGWDYNLRLYFHNDPENLVVSDAHMNRTKGAKGIDKWSPPFNRCGYALQWKYLLNKYELKAEQSIHDEIEQLCEFK